MITPAYLCAMAACISEMNRRLHGPVAHPTDVARRQGCDAFRASIHANQTHIIWNDRTWTSRLGGWNKPTGSLKQSAEWLEDFGALHAAREAADAGIEQWAATVVQAWCDPMLSWFSDAAQREVSVPCRPLGAHFFSQQPHHRGQADALITAGERSEDTSLFPVAPEVVA